MSTRTGFLSDENMKKMCVTHKPVPMNRPDLLPANPVNTSGIYTRKLKEMPVLQRPAKASYMTESVQNITGIDIAASYVNQLEKRIDRKPAKMLSRAFGGVDQQTYTNLSSISDVANLLYEQEFTDLGLTGLTDVFSGDIESLPASDVPATIATTPTMEEPVEEPVEEETTTAEMETQTRKSQGEYLVEFLKKPRPDRERTIRLILRKYRNNQLVSPIPDIPTQPSKTQTERIFREFLDDIYQADYNFDLDELLQLPTSESGAPTAPA
jgi:hypothetical protein